MLTADIVELAEEMLELTWQNRDSKMPHSTCIYTAPVVANLWLQLTARSRCRCKRTAPLLGRRARLVVSGHAERPGK